MNKNYNILVLDDNPVIVKSIIHRISNLNDSYSYQFNFTINSHYYDINLANYNHKSLSNFIKAKNITHLALDRGFFELSINDDLVLTKKNGAIKKIDELLRPIDFTRLKQVKRAIVYTYDEPDKASEWYVESSALQNEMADCLGGRFQKSDIDVIRSNSEIYQYSGVNLYEKEGEPYDNEYNILGLIPDFKLYGLFLGELIYHRVLLTIIQSRKQQAVKKKKSRVLNVVLLYIMLTSIAIGANSIYDLFESTKVKPFLIYVAVVLGLILPVFIIIAKPDILLSIDDE